MIDLQTYPIGSVWESSGGHKYQVVAPEKHPRKLNEKAKAIVIDYPDGAYSMWSSGYDLGKRIDSVPMTRINVPSTAKYMEALLP